MTSEERERALREVVGAESVDAALSAMDLRDET